MEISLAKGTLQKFKREIEELPEFQNKNEERTFLQLQKYNLLYVTPEGKFKITKRGEDALNGDVEKYLQLERYEARLIKDSLRGNMKTKWLFFAVIPFIFILTLILIFAAM